MPDDLEGGGSRGGGALRGERELDALFQELDSLSCCEGDDSGPDMDSLSVGSTPKPSLRPFFTNSKNMLHENLMGWCDQLTVFLFLFLFSVTHFIFPFSSKMCSWTDLKTFTTHKQ